MLRSLALVLLLSATAAAQLPSKIGYVFPPGGPPGTTAAVTLGGYDWTPDVEFLSLEPGAKIELTGKSSPVLMPLPPFWFGAKARGPADPLPREFPAKITVPANAKPGPLRWHVVSANGGSPVGMFWVSPGFAEVTEVFGRKAPQALPALPAAVSGQIQKIEEIDRYTFTVPADGLVTCELIARRVNSLLSGIVQVHDAQGRVVADVADTEGEDLAFTFAAKAKENYTLTIYDVDYHGDRACVYRLELSTGPRVVATIPAAGKRGSAADVEFVGWGIASGAAKLETLTKRVDFPKDAAESFTYKLDTPHGACTATIKLSDADEPREPADATAANRTLTVPCSVSGRLDERYGTDRFTCAGKKGDAWLIKAEACACRTKLDPAIAVFDAEGKQVAQNDDAVVGASEAEIYFTLPADGPYQIAVSDSSGESGTLTTIYHLTLQAAEADFALNVAAETLDIPFGGKATLAVPAVRLGGLPFTEPIQISITGLPAGVTVPADQVIAAKKTDVKVEISSDETGSVSSSFFTVTGTCNVGEKTITHSTKPILLTRTIKPPFSLVAEGKDDVRTVPRGSTFPAPVLVTRNEGFSGEINLEMTSKQERHRQGVEGPELLIAPGVERIEYPVFLPEWLETTKTSRIVLNGVAKVKDPAGRERYSLDKMKLRIGMLPKEALLKIAHAPGEFELHIGEALTMPVAVTRGLELTEPAEFTLRVPEELSGLVKAEKLTANAGAKSVTIRIETSPDPRLVGEHELTIRATALQRGYLPVIAETSLLVNFLPPRPAVSSSGGK